MVIGDTMQLALIAIAFMAAIWGGIRFSALSANANVDRYTDQELRSFPVAAGVHIYRNALVGVDPAGMLKPFVPGDRLAGISYDEADNTSGLAAAITCPVYTLGDYDFALSGAAYTDTGRAVFATADNAIALTGHPDAFVGRILTKCATDKVTIRLKSAGERPRNGEGCIELLLTGQEAFTATGAIAGTVCVNGFDLKSILGLGWTMNDAEDGGFKCEFDATSEVALGSCRTRNDCLPVDKGLSIDLDFLVTGTRAAAIDINIGFGTALTTNSEADIDHADMAQLAAFNIAAGSDNINFQSDNATTDVAATDTTKDNDTSGATFKHLKVIGRPTGVCEAWVDGVRVLPTTAFAMLSTANVGAFVNMEKTADAAVAAMFIRNLRVAAGMSVLAA